ncbi:phosphate ABC transporter substrate-binding protein PstS [Aphanothece hegewaldii CCALA 016]|uniref:Phosphate-binding protein n=2 Tax=Aphanothece TaxID=1121 RepID=A0A2T1LSG4_9CHRO|nr:phosphate ABC transporter substrate-binding protein PstS [Aphanothece hegewaldii CCALA 016]
MRKISQLASSLTLLALTASLAACGGGGTNTSTNSTSGTTEGARQVPLSGNVAVTGAGASFPAPLYQNWLVQLNREVPQLQINYQSVGSGAGVEQFTQGTIDFGASDVAMTDKEMANVKDGVLLLPMTAGSIAVAYNLPGVEGLKLSRDAFIGIFKGEITKWNDPQIAAANPDLKLPDTPITVVHRADGSGTTGIFTMHLSAISPEWKKSIGQGKTVQWPTSKGKFLGGRGNEGVTATIKQNEGTIGYIEYGFAKNNGLAMAALENKEGKFTLPDEAAASATLASEPLPEDMRLFFSDPPGETSYPIVTYSWMLMHKSYPDKDKAIGIEAMIEYGLTTGQKQSAALGYVPLPPEVVKKVAAVADQISPDYTIKVE